MASAVDICNEALSHIGADAVVTSISPPDGSVEAGHCARFYPIARRTAMEAHPWTFAKIRVALAEVTNDSDLWQYAYAKPSDCIRPLRVIQQLSMAGVTVFTQDDIPAIPGENGSADYEIEGDVIRTNEPDAVLLYVRDVTDTTKFTPAFTSGVGMLLAGYLSGPIIKGLDGMKIGQAWTQSGMAALDRAATIDANASSERAEHQPHGIQARA